MKFLKLKKAAMFGLDARIALAIFGALSVISGAALYSAIQDAKVTALLTEVNEIGKAWEQYMLDTGFDMPITTDQYRHTTKLIEDTVAGWNGPYLTGYEKYTAPDDYVLKSKYAVSPIYLFSLNDDNWDTWNPDGVCTSGQSCYLYIAMGVSDAYSSIVKKLDIKLDGSATPNSGSVRWANDAKFFYLKYSAVKNHNN